MFEVSIIEVDNQKSNTILKRSINLDQNLDCFLMISSSNKNLAENLLNHSLESIIDKISKEETYNDFWIALENINSFLKSWRADSIEVEDDVDMSILILNENNLMFSNIWKSTVYLINKNTEIIELTERNENKKSFLFISSGILANSEIIISSTVNILKYLSKSDILDGMILSNDIEVFNKNIKNILQSEILEKNCIISSLKYKNEFVWVEENKNLTAIKDFTIKILDTNLSKKVIGWALKLKDKIARQNKAVKNTIFFSLIAILIFILFLVVSKIIYYWTNTSKKEEASEQMSELQLVINEATKNVSNPWIFNRNIEKAEEIIKKLEEKKLYLWDLENKKEEINILKKQFNKIEIFNSSKDNLVYEIKDANVDPVKVLQESWKTYIITKKWIIWPIIAKTTPKTYTFNSLSDTEEFIDWGILGQDVYLVTNNSKVVKFNKNWTFSFSNVAWQQAWEKIKSVDPYNSSIYTLWEDNQIYKHQAVATWFWKWTSYLKEEDLKSLWNIRDIAIDWGFYIVKDNLSVMKFFSNPYRLESLTLSKLPKNYNLEEWKRFEIKSWKNLSYVYMLLNDKIFIFNTNAKDYLSTRNLTYVWQIEWWNEKILDFTISRDKKDLDWEILVLNKKWVYKLTFEERDSKVYLR